MPKHKRPYVHALYGFARYADEIVDDLASTLSPAEKEIELRTWSSKLLDDLKNGISHDHIGRALVDTVNRWNIPLHYFEAFLKSMAMDLTITQYQKYDDLMEYVYGSAAVIGLEMVHILGVEEAADFERALTGAKSLGIAFQLANFIRDVGEDLDRGRIYLPIEELEEFGINRQALERREVTKPFIQALKFQISRVRELKRESDSAIQYLAHDAIPCIQAASELYCGIVDEVEAINYDVFNKRAKTSMVRRGKVAFSAWRKMQKISH